MLNCRGNPAVFDISHDEFVRLTMGRYYVTMKALEEYDNA